MKYKEMKRCLAYFFCFCLNIKFITAQTNLLNVAITSTNRGTQTDFVVRTNFGGSMNLNNVWLGIGFNSGRSMVCNFKYEIKLIN